MNWKHYVFGIPTVVAIFTSLTYFGLDLSGLRPAWAFELQKLAGVVYKDLCKSRLDEWYRAKESEEVYKRREEPIPQWLLDKLIDLEAELIEYGCRERRENDNV